MSKHVFHCIDAHTCGNPVRLVMSGAPPLRGKNMSEKRQHFLRDYDWIRTGLMFEPRGHDMMSGSILYAPHDPQNDVAVLFIETSGCLPMCGHGTIGTITIGIEKKIDTARHTRRCAHGNTRRAGVGSLQRRKWKGSFREAYQRAFVFGS